MKLETLTANVRRWLGHGVVLLLAAMVLNVTWQVVTRYLLGAPSPYTEELARILLVWLGLFGGAFATGHQDHIALDLLPLSDTIRRTVRAVSMSLFGLLLSIGGLGLVRFTLALEQRSAALGLPLYWIYIAAPVAGLLIVFFSVAGFFIPAPGEEASS